jgi:hypothetical protein
MMATIVWMKEKEKKTMTTRVNGEMYVTAPQGR